MIDEEKFNQVLQKIQELKNGKNPLDLSSKEDLAIAIMNLISLEEHFFYTYNKTGDAKHLDLLNQTREIRKDLLKEIVKNPKGEIWCISKHLLATTMRLMEVGTKKLSEGEKGNAEDLLKKAYELWNIFWGLNLGLIQVKDINSENAESNESPVVSLTDEATGRKNEFSVWSKIGKMIQEVLDCCKE